MIYIYGTSCVEHVFFQYLGELPKRLLYFQCRIRNDIFTTQYYSCLAQLSQCSFEGVWNGPLPSRDPCSFYFIFPRMCQILLSPPRLRYSYSFCLRLITDDCFSFLLPRSPSRFPILLLRVLVAEVSVPLSLNQL